MDDECTRGRPFRRRRCLPPLARERERPLYDAVLHRGTSLPHTLCPLTAKMNERNEIGYPSEVHLCLYEIHPGKGVNYPFGGVKCDYACVFPLFPKRQLATAATLDPRG